MNKKPIYFLTTWIRDNSPRWTLIIESTSMEEAGKVIKIIKDNSQTNIRGGEIYDFDSDDHILFQSYILSEVEDVGNLELL